MTQWTSGELDTIGELAEIRIAAERPDGTLHRWTPIWVVRVAADLYVRSALGTQAAWYRHTTRGQTRVEAGGIERRVRLDLQPDQALRAAVDAAYRSKYGDSPFLDSLVSTTAQSTTSRLVPEA